MSEDAKVPLLKGGVTPLGWLAYGLAAVWIVLDQLVKYWIVEVFHLPAKGQVPVTSFFSLSMVMNRGVSFGLLRADADLARWALAAFALVVAVALALWVRRAGHLLIAVALGLIMGGALGNMIDRIRFGAVVDFLDFSGLYFPWVFNVADCGVSVGIALVLLDSVFERKTP